MTVIYFQQGWDADYVEAGGPGSPNFHKSNALKTMRARPELHGTLLARGTWDHELVDGLKPQPGDIIIPKTRYSGFFNSTLDSVLRSRRHPQPRLRRHRHQRLRRIDAARRLHARIFRRHARGRDPPGRARLRQAGDRLQHRDPSSAGSPPSPISAAPSARSRKTGERLMPFEPINPPHFPTPIAPYSAGHAGGRHGLCLGHAGAGRGRHRPPSRRCRRADPPCPRDDPDHARGRRRDPRRRRLQPHLPRRLGRLCGDERGLCGIFSGREAGALLHPVRPGEARPAGRDRQHRACRLMPHAAGLWYEWHGPEDGEVLILSAGLGGSANLLAAESRGVRRTLPRAALRSSRHGASVRDLTEHA